MKAIERPRFFARADMFFERAPLYSTVPVPKHVSVGRGCRFLPCICASSGDRERAEGDGDRGGAAADPSVWRRNPK